MDGLKIVSIEGWTLGAAWLFVHSPARYTKDRPCTGQNCSSIAHL